MIYEGYSQYSVVIYLNCCNALFSLKNIDLFVLLITLVYAFFQLKKKMQCINNFEKDILTKVRFWEYTIRYL